MEIPGAGRLTYDEDLDWWVSERRPVGALGGAVCELTIDDFDGDGPDGQIPEDVREVVAKFVRGNDLAFRGAAAPIYAYYRDVREEFGADLSIAGPDEVWKHVTIGENAHISVDDEKVYVSVECECSWEPEHGLQIVFEGAVEVVKVGPYDGHFTNESAYGRPELAGLVYVPVSSL